MVRRSTKIEGEGVERPLDWAGEQPGDVQRKEGARRQPVYSYSPNLLQEVIEGLKTTGECKNNCKGSL